MKKEKIIKKKYIKLVFVAVIGLFSGVFSTGTYALPLYSMYDAPNSITRIPPQYSYVPNQASSGQVPNFEAILENEKYKVFCLDRHGNYDNQEKLVRKGEVPYPLTYIASKTIPYVNYDMDDTTNKACKDAENIWIGQAAIWYYLDNKNIDTYRKSGKLNLVKGDEEGDEAFNYGIEETGSLNYVSYITNPITNENMNGDDEKNPKCTKYGKDLWNAAVALANTAAGQTDPSKNLTFNLSKSKVSKTEDGKSYKTDLVKFETLASNNIESYKLEIPNAPKDTKVYDQNSNEITDLNNIDGNRSFYIVIPKTSFSSEKINFNIKVTANFNFVKGYYYEDEAGKNQPVMLLGNESTTKSAELVFSDDTALNISNSIYFIGFVILISGAGIIYANVRPRTKESEY